MGRTAVTSLRVPLGRPVVPLGADRLARQHRSCLVAGIGDEGMARLAASRVLVIGAGGLGSPVLLYLAAAGVGTVGISDTDVVELTNLQRQVIHTEASVGTPKTLSAAKRLRGLDSSMTIVEHPAMTADLLDELDDDYDLVVECTDNFDSKYLVADWCAAHGKPLVWATVVGCSFQLSVFWTTPDGTSRTLRDLHPTRPEPGTTPSSLEVGVLGPVVGQAGSAQATEAVKLITGMGTPLFGRVLVADAAAGRFDVIPFAPRRS